MTPSDQDRAREAARKVIRDAFDMSDLESGITQALLAFAQDARQREREEIAKMCAIEAMLLIPAVNGIVRDREKEIEELKALRTPPVEEERHD